MEGSVREILTPEIAPRMGIVLVRPGSELMPRFMQGRVRLEPEPERECILRQWCRSGGITTAGG